MAIKLTMIAPKRQNTRSMSYSTKKIRKIIEDLGWKHNLDLKRSEWNTSNDEPLHHPGAYLCIVTYWKQFDTKQEAVKGKKEIEQAMYNQLSAKLADSIYFGQYKVEEVA